MFTICREKRDVLSRFSFLAIKFRAQLPCVTIERLKWISIAPGPPVHLYGSHAERFGPDKKPDITFLCRDAPLRTARGVTDTVASERAFFTFLFVFLRAEFTTPAGRFRMPALPISALRNSACAIAPPRIISAGSPVSESRFLLIVPRRTREGECFTRGRASFLAGQRIIGFVFFGVLRCLYAATRSRITIS